MLLERSVELHQRLLQPQHSGSQGPQHRVFSQTLTENEETTENGHICRKNFTLASVVVYFKLIWKQSCLFKEPNYPPLVIDKCRFPCKNQTGERTPGTAHFSLLSPEGEERRANGAFPLSGKGCYQCFINNSDDCSTPPHRVLSAMLNFDKFFTVFRNTRLASIYNSVLASQIHSSSVHSPASKYKTLICLAMAPNGTGFQKRGRVNKTEAFVNVDFHIYGEKYKLCLMEEVELEEQVRKTPQQIRRRHLCWFR